MLPTYDVRELLLLHALPKKLTSETYMLRWLKAHYPETVTKSMLRASMWFLEKRGFAKIEKRPRSRAYAITRKGSRLLKQVAEIQKNLQSSSS